MGMNHYLKIRDLGGTNGAFLAEDKQDRDRRVVIKRLATGAQGMEELNVTLRLRHPNIIRLVESFVHEDGNLYEVLQYEPGGDLESFLSHLMHLRKQPTLATLLRWYAQLLRAVAFCHENRVIHRDIKPSNIFMSGDTKTIFLGDFGSAKSLQPMGSNLTSTFVGTPLWLSPEVLLGEPYSFSSDMWSLGCVFYEIATGHRPFSCTSFARLVQDVTAGRIAAFPPSVSPAVKTLILSMLRVVPAERITAAAALQQVEALVAEQSRRNSAVELTAAAPLPAPAQPTPNTSVTEAPRSGPRVVEKSPPLAVSTAAAAAAAAAAAEEHEEEEEEEPVRSEIVELRGEREDHHHDGEWTAMRAEEVVLPAVESEPSTDTEHVNSSRRTASQHPRSAPSSTTHSPTVPEPPGSRRAPSSASAAARANGQDSGADDDGVRISGWLRAHDEDFNVIENYLLKFRAHDVALLDKAKSEETAAEPPARAPPVVAAPTKLVFPNHRSASPAAKHPSPPRGSRAWRSADAVVPGPGPKAKPSNYCRPSPGRQRAGKRISVVSRPAAPTVLSHNPRQASHARPVHLLTPQERQKLDSELEVQRAKRNEDREQMRLLIQKRRMEARNKKDLGVKIVLPDQLEYTDNGVVRMGHAGTDDE